MPESKERPIIVLAAHDDGSGAHVTMYHICRAIFQATKNLKCKPLIVYLHGANFSTEWAKELWNSTSESIEWLKCNLDEFIKQWPNEEELQAKAGIWVSTNNMIRLETTKSGELDPAKTKEGLVKKGSNFEHWELQIGSIPEERVVLTIEMGVPQLNKWAKSRKNHKPPAITVGDQVWSLVLQKTLELSGEYDEEVAEAILKLAEYERCATEAWFLPLLAPRNYADHYALANIPLYVLSGFFGQRPTAEDKKMVWSQISDTWSLEMEDDLRKNKKKLIVMSAGSRGVWKDVNNEVSKFFFEHGGEHVLLFSQRENEVNLLRGRELGDAAKLWMVTEGDIREMRQLTSLLPYFAIADLGVTRGGVSSLEFVNARTPLLVVQEPNHWLSLKQQASLREAGLAYSCSLLNFQKNHVELIRKYLGAQYKQREQNEKMKARMGFMSFGIEDEWVQYILKHHTKIRS